MKLFIFVGLISITFAQYGGDDEGYEDGGDQSFAGYGQEGYGTAPNQGYEGQLAQLAGGGHEAAGGYDGGYEGGDSGDAGEAGDAGAALGQHGGFDGGYEGGDDGSDGTPYAAQNAGGDDAGSIYAQAAAGAGGEGLEGLGSAFDGGDD